jgi:hypothetical protein
MELQGGLDDIRYMLQQANMVVRWMMELLILLGAAALGIGAAVSESARHVGAWQSEAHAQRVARHAAHRQERIVQIDEEMDVLEHQVAQLPLHHPARPQLEDKLSLLSVERMQTRGEELEPARMR